MSLTTLFRRLAWRSLLALQSRKRSSARRRLATARPGLEWLEDRLAPATLTVNTYDDEVAADKYLSLREAINVANTGSKSGLSPSEQALVSGTLGSNDTIKFASSLNGKTITLTGGELIINKNLTITGPGAGKLAISGDNASRVFDVRPETGTISVTFSGLTISNGDALDGVVGGGAIYNVGILTLENCAISGNMAPEGGSIMNEDQLTLTNCTLSNNGMNALAGFITDSADGDGGGILNQGNLTVSNCTFSGNSAFKGGGIYNDLNHMMIISNSTFSTNSATTLGGGIFNASGAAFYDTIIATNSATGGGPDIFALIPITSLGHNLIGNNADASGFGASGDLQNVNPLLAPLGNYGGPTETVALLPGSPAINAGDNTGVPATDQRGITRIQLGTIDIGAFESRGFSLSNVSGSNQSTAVNTAFAAPLVVQVTAKNALEPVAGGEVTYTGPHSGASLSPNPGPATIAANGQASLTATANASAGSYNVQATARGAKTAKGAGFVAFRLTNTAGGVPGAGGAGGPAAVFDRGPAGGTAPAEDALGGGATGPSGDAPWLNGGTASPPATTASGPAGLGLPPLTDLGLRPSVSPAMLRTNLADPATSADLINLILL